MGTISEVLKWEKEDKALREHLFRAVDECDEFSSAPYLPSQYHPVIHAARKLGQHRHNKPEALRETEK